MHSLHVLFLAACASSQPPPLAPIVSATPHEDLDATISRETTVGGVTYVFRASHVANVLYTLDCASGLTHCSKPAYEDSLALDQDDRDALEVWRKLHLHYTGQLVSREETNTPPPLPIMSPVARNLVPHIRLAAYGADDLNGALDRMSVLLEPGDVGAAEKVIRRFQPRADKLWRARRAELATKVDAFAKLVQRKDVGEILEHVLRFYAPDLPPSPRDTFEILPRPKHDGGDFGEQIADHALVETRIEEPAEARLDVVLHELFHSWFAAAPYERKLALARAFAASSNPVALPAYGLLDESLATAFGNGLVSRAVDREGFEKRLAKPLGLYHDPFIDPNVKAILGWIETYAASGKTLYDAEFLDGYLPLVAAAFPKGIAPAMRMRPLVTVYDAGLDEIDSHLRHALNPSWAESDSGFGREGRELLAKHPLWGTAVLVLAARVDQVLGVEKHVDAKAIARLHTEAAKKTPFVVTLTRAGAEPIFVFVAQDAASLTALVDRFAALDAPIADVWR